jgi:hypothetical protein
LAYSGIGDDSKCRNLVSEDEEEDDEEGEQRRFGSRQLGRRFEMKVFSNPEAYILTVGRESRCALATALSRLRGGQVHRSPRQKSWS